MINPLEAARRRAAASGTLLSLVESDFRRAGLHMPDELYAEAAARTTLRRAMDQSGRGPAAARAAVAAWLTRDGLPTDADQIVLTSGSSVSYHLLFRALVDRAVWDRDGAGGAPGAPGPSARARPNGRGGVSPPSVPRVLLPRPGYPLFEQLAAAASVEVGFYALDVGRGWSLPDDGRSAVRPQGAAAVRSAPAGASAPAAHDASRGSAPADALVVISPNNPTGAIHAGASVAGLADAVLAPRGIIIADEVFSAFRPPGGLARPAGVAAPAAPLPSGAPLPPGAEATGPAAPVAPAVPAAPEARTTATLNGLSKLCGAPEVKAGWIAVHGPAAAALVEYLDTLHDAYLTLSAHAAAALEVFLHPDADDARAALATEVMARRARWIDALAAIPWLRVHPTPGGIHLIADVDPSLRPELDDEELAVALLDETGVLLHPGYLYDVPEPRRLVATCLAPLDPEVAARRLRRFGR